MKLRNGTRAARGCVYGVLFGLILWAMIIAIWLWRANDALSQPACSCVGREGCEHVILEAGEGRMVRGIRYTSNGADRYCLRIEPPHS